MVSKQITHSIRVESCEGAGTEELPAKNEGSMTLAF
jgi:hypothetical protein